MSTLTTENYWDKFLERERQWATDDIELQSIFIKNLLELDQTDAIISYTQEQKSYLGELYQRKIRLETVGLDGR